MDTTVQKLELLNVTAPLLTQINILIIGEYILIITMQITVKRIYPVRHVQNYQLKLLAVLVLYLSYKSMYTEYFTLDDNNRFCLNFRQHLKSHFIPLFIL